MNTEQTSVGFFSSLKNTLSPSALIERFNITSAFLVEAGIYLSVGFLVGFLLKRYGKIVFLTVLFFAAVLIAQQLEFISLSFNWDTIQAFFGITPPDASTTLPAATVWDWVRGHIVLVLCGLGGFLLGLRLG
jgi:hypothetical protein